MTKDRKNHEVSGVDYVVAATGPLVCFFIVPMNVIANNLAELQHLDLKLAFFGLLGVALAVSALCLLLLRGMAISPVLARLAKLLALPLLVFLTLTGLVLPLTTDTGQIETVAIPTNWPNLAIAGALAALLLLPVPHKLGRLVLTFVVLFALGTGIFASATVLNQNTDDAFDHLVAASSGNNIFVVSFDGLSRDATNRLVHSNPEFSEAFKDFTLFERAISTAPSTQTSLTSETVGGVDLKTLYSTEENMYATLDKDSSITSYLSRNGVDVSIYGYYSFTFSDESRIVAPWTVSRPSQSEKIQQVGLVFELAMARLISPPLSFGPGIARLATAWATPQTATTSADDVVLEVQGHLGYGWDIPNITGIRDYYSYVNELHVGTSRPAAFFMHFLHTHYPIDFDADCSYRSNDPGWFEANQNSGGLNGETSCALKQYSLFLEKLKALGIYDGALIVLKSDHGQPHYYHDPKFMESFSIRDHAYWGYARHTPWLAIKQPNQTQQRPVISNRPVALSDLAVTLCKVATPDSTCDEFVGYDALSKDEIPADATYWVNLLMGPESSFKMDTHQSVPVPRSGDFYVRVTEILSNDILTDALPCGTEVNLAAGTPFNNGLTADGRWITWRDGLRQFIRWSESDCAATSVSVALERRSASELPGAKVLVDDQAVVANVSAASSDRILVNLPLKAGNGAHTVELLMDGVNELTLQTLTIN